MFVEDERILVIHFGKNLGTWKLRTDINGCSDGSPTIASPLIHQAAMNCELERAVGFLGGGGDWFNQYFSH